MAVSLIGDGIFFVAVAWSYNRSADRNEQDFADMVEN